MAQYELNLQDYLRIINKRKFVIISSIVIFAISSFFYISNQVPVYEAVTTVKVEEKKTAVVGAPSWSDYGYSDFLETQTKVIKGFPVLKRAAERMGYIVS